ncbi:MAG: UvrD-helicase domain-containing protein [Elusimicrobia bacterium]|nr:UvrD-helicase domain-containing protein [Elusimicrobiota bacterium]
MRLTDAQDRDFASFALDSNIIVEAGAGTGKTRILVDRLCFRLLAKDDPIESFVALTFTEKAAAELKLRLSVVLGAIVSGRSEAGSQSAALLDRLSALSPGQGKRFQARAAAALSALDRAQIGTIHSFASHILRLYPLEAGVDPAFEVDEGPVFDELFDSEFGKWLEAELTDNNPRARDWEKLLLDVEVEELRGLAGQLCLEKTGTGGADSEKNAAAFCAKAAEEARALAVKMAPEGKKSRKIEQVLFWSAAVLGNYGKSAGTAPEGEGFAGAALSRPKDWEEEDFSRAKKIAALASALSGGGQVIALAEELLRPFADRFRQFYSDRGAISFDGLLVRARNLLRDNCEVRNSLKRKYLAVFIDEFQDTDPLQGELLLYLCETAGASASDWRDIRLQAGKLFVVGDPKQSIYRFRGADMGAYGQFTGLMEKQGARKCFLTNNFRSRAGIINAVNALSAPVIKAREGFQPEYVPIVPAIDDGAGEACCASLLLYSPPAKALAGDSRSAQAAELARLVKGMVSPKAGGLRFRDVAVLVRSVSPLPYLIEALRDADIPYVVEEDRYFYGTQEVCDMLGLLRALAEPGNKIAVAGLLRSPLSPLGDDELYELKQAADFDYLKPPPSGFARLEGFYALLKRLHELSGRMPLGAFVRQALADTRCRELLSAAYNGQQTLANVEKFASIAAEFGERGGGSVEVFLAQAGRYMDQRRGEGESPLADESLDAVRIMTVHKAKGLEFPVVFLPDVCAASGGNQKRPMLQDWSLGLRGLRMGAHCDGPMAVLEFRAAEQQSEEEKRILYVALTRAKQRLFLLGGPKPARDSFAAYIRQAGFWPEDGKGLPDGLALSAEYIKGAGAAARGAGKAKAGRSLSTQECGEWALAWEARSSAYEAAHESIASSATAQMEREHETLPPDREEPEQARLAGLICHKVLERHDFKSSFSKAEIAAAVSSVEFEEGEPLPAEAMSAAGKLLMKFGSGPAYAEIAGARVLARELPFSYIEPGGARPAAMRGVMDLVLDRGVSIAVLDYKSAGAKALSGGRYAAQKALYLKAAARIFPGRKIEFYFVSLSDGALL